MKTVKNVHYQQKIILASNLYFVNNKEIVNAGALKGLISELS